jgi:hypothetical protein
MWNPFKNNMRENEQAGENNHGDGAGNSPENCRRPADWQVDPKKAQIHNLIIVDESGSMSGLEKVTVGGITETIATIKKAQEDFGDTQQHYLTLVTFDSGSGNEPPIRTHFDDVPIVTVDDFTNYHPRGCTPLFDAMGETLTRLHESIKDNANATGVVTVITDGMENASRKWTGNALRHLIEQLKEEGWTFSYMGSCHDVVEVTMKLSIDHVMEFDHDAVGASNTWRRDMSSKQAYYERMAREFDPNEELAMKRAKMRRNASNYYANRVTPDWIDSLAENEVFVFGSNPQGNHAGGAAAYAVEHFGAIIGQGEGPQGQSYAIPTTGDFALFVEAVERFIDYAIAHPDTRFLVTRLGLGNAGRSINEVAHVFYKAIKVENISLPEELWEKLGLHFLKK